MHKFMIILVSLALCVFRVYAALLGWDMHTRQMLWFRDGAHLWCGFLIGVIWLHRQFEMQLSKEFSKAELEFDREERRWVSFPLIILIAIELISALGIPYARAQGWI